MKRPPRRQDSGQRPIHDAMARQAKEEKRLFDYAVAQSRLYGTPPEEKSPGHLAALDAFHDAAFGAQAAGTPREPQDAIGTREGSVGASPAPKGRAGRIRSNATPSRGAQGPPPARPVLRAEVMGAPLAYGSKRGFYNPKLRRVMLVNENHENLRTWQDAFRKAMLAADEFAGENRLGPKKIALAIYLARPKGHYRKDGSLSALGLRSPYPTRKPDAEKCGRAVADCGTGIWYSGDEQLVEWRISKRWAPDGLERTVVEVEEMEEST